MTNDKNKQPQQDRQNPHYIGFIKPNFLKEEPVPIETAYIKAKPFYPTNYKSNNNITLYDDNKSHYDFKPTLRKKTIIF